MHGEGGSLLFPGNRNHNFKFMGGSAGARTD